MNVLRVQRLRLALRLASVAAIVGVGAAVVWFGFAAVAASGAQMAASSAVFAAVASGWSGAFAAITAKLKSGEAAQAAMSKRARPPRRGVRAGSI